MQGKIICKHHNCWKSNLTDDDRNMRIYIYFYHRKRDEYPILYDGIFVFEIPKGRDVKETRSIIENTFKTN